MQVKSHVHRPNSLSKQIHEYKIKVVTDVESLGSDCDRTHLVEPRALQNEHAPAKELQNDVVLDEHLQHDAGRPGKHGHQQQGVDVRVQNGPHVDVVIEQEP